MKKNALLVATIAAISFVGNAQNNGNGNSNALPNNGNVGVGTTNPTAQLHVNGKMKVDSTVTMNDTLFVQSTAQVSESLRVDGATEMEDVVINGTLWMPNLQDANSTDFEVLVSMSDGTIYGTGPGGLFPVPNEPVGFCDLQGSPYLNNPYWVSEPNKLYTACPDVFVGIGTNSPDYNLQVDGSSFIKGNVGIGVEPDASAQFNTQTTKEVGICIDHNWQSPYGYAFKAILNNDQTKGIGLYSNLYSKDMFTVYGDGKMEIQNPTGTTMQLEPNGRLVINGTSGTTLQLESDGLLRARSVKIDVDAWPDYVFEEDYELKSLDEIKTYIAEHGHLPNVPSAEVVEAEGMNVAEMNKILLEKLEELTLLVIEQDEKIKKLEETIQK